jgi:hypothetical protein
MPMESSFEDEPLCKIVNRAFVPAGGYPLIAEVVGAEGAGTGDRGWANGTRYGEPRLAAACAQAGR